MRIEKGSPESKTLLGTLIIAEEQNVTRRCDRREGGGVGRGVAGGSAPREKEMRV